MDRQKFAFDKTNFILLAIGMAVIIVGFLLMTGPSSTEGYFEPDIFSVRRIKVAPLTISIGKKDIKHIRTLNRPLPPQY